MSALGWTILAICVVALVVALAIVSRRGGGTRSLRRRFGPEYDRAVEQSGDRRAAERHLSEIAHRRDRLDIRPLDDRERADYSSRWDGLQARFVDDPGGATRQADQAITDVMRARGYPEVGVDERVELLSAERPLVAGAYRQANADAARPADGDGTEGLRSAFVHYRTVYAWLVDGLEPVDGTTRTPAEDADRRPALSGPERRRA